MRESIGWNGSLSDGVDLEEVITTAYSLTWKRWAVALGAVAAVWLLAIQE